MPVNDFTICIIKLLHDFFPQFEKGKQMTCINRRPTHHKLQICFDSTALKVTDVGVGTGGEATALSAFSASRYTTEVIQLWLYYDSFDKNLSIKPFLKIKANQALIKAVL